MVMRILGFLYESNILVIRVMYIAICFQKPSCASQSVKLMCGS